MRLFEARRAALIGILVSAGALAAAFATEWGLGLIPCALCLVERWPYRIGIALGLLALLWARGCRVVLGVMAAVMLTGAGLGTAHVGVEHGWWPSPLPECAAPDLGHGTAAERLARMPLFPAKPCDEPTYLVPGIPISMAMANLLLALALSIYLAISAVGQRKPA